MRKFNLRNIGAFGTALALTTSLCACSLNDNDIDNPILPDNDKTISDVNPTEDDEKDIIISNIETKKDVLSDDEVLACLTDEDKSFRLKESFLNENGTLTYQEFGPEFYEKEINGLKYLINAETKKVCISGYSNLGRFCCLKTLKKENGGVDDETEYSGYVLLAIYNVEGETLFSLYDFDDFTPLLDKCDLSSSTSFVNDIFNMYHISSYDPKYRGHDDEGEYAGYIFRVVKDDVCYFVDVNDFTKIVLSGDFTFYDENISSTGNATINYRDYTLREDVLYRSEDLVPTYSDVLQKTLVKAKDK